MMIDHFHFPFHFQFLVSISTVSNCPPSPPTGVAVLTMMRLHNICHDGPCPWLIINFNKITGSGLDPNSSYSLYNPCFLGQPIRLVTAEMLNIKGEFYLYMCHMMTIHIYSIIINIYIVKFYNSIC